MMVGPAPFLQPDRSERRVAPTAIVGNDGTAVAPMGHEQISGRDHARE
jgi:hypothetical protein